MKTDTTVFELIEKEHQRQLKGIELIASENFVSDEVMKAMGSWLTNKYAEGYPGKRYYGGCQVVDEVESLAIERVCKLFGAEYANVQPHSGAQANAAVFLACLKPGDTFMGLNLDHGGHLSHGSAVNTSGILYHAIGYNLNKETGRVDYDEMEKLALEHRPKMIIGGGSAYSREWNYARMREIADKVGAIFMVDMAHPAGLIAAGLLVYMKKIMPRTQIQAKTKSKFVMRKKYMPYYLTLVAYGCQKRIKLVFGPWIIIELMGKGADTVALLGIVTSFIGAFFSKYLGKMLDEKGLKYTMIFEGGYLLVVIAALGAAAGALERGGLGSHGIWVFLVYCLYILAFLLEQFNMVHAFMMRKLAIDPSEVIASLSVGLSLDHILAITVSAVLGVIWEKFGAEYVFFLTAATSLMQIGVGLYMGRQLTKQEMQR